MTGSASFKTVDAVADGTGLSSRAGSALLALTAQRLGLTDALSGALAGTRKCRSSHDPGRVLCDLAVMAADGGRCVPILAVLAGQGALFGDVASVPTARRLPFPIGQAQIDRIRRARALARQRAWKAGAAPDRVILDFDATPISVHSEKEHAAGHYKGGFGFNPLLVSCEREVLAGVLRPGKRRREQRLRSPSRARTRARAAPAEHPGRGQDRPARIPRASSRNDFAFGCREDKDLLLARLRDQRECPRADPHACRRRMGARRQTRTVSPGKGNHGPPSSRVWSTFPTGLRAPG